MKKSLTVGILIGIIIIIVIGGNLASQDETIKMESDNIPLTLYVSNQSFQIDFVDIVIQIDGEKIIEDNFKVGDQSELNSFELQLTKGNHTIHVMSESGGVEFEKQFEMSEERWMYLLYINDETQPSQFQLKIFNDDLEFFSEMKSLTRLDSKVTSSANKVDFARDALIIIQGNSNRGLVDNSIQQGFLAGTRTQMDIDMVKELKPQFWRVGDFNSNTFVKERFPEVKTQILISDLLEDRGKAKPWKNWEEYEEKITSIVQYSKDNSPVDYFDIWSEPDGLWSGTSDQFFEMIKRTHNVIRSVDPNAKIVGPSSSNYNEAGYAQFLDFLVANNLRFDGLSWHEFNIPEDLPIHVASARSMIDSRPSLGPIEIQINEFSSGQNHLIPGWTLGWIYYLDVAKVDWASRACWEREVGDMSQTSECVKGLNGIFAFDERTPQPIYWVHKFYADMKGTKLDVSISNPKIVALASRDDNTKEIQVVVGRYSCGQTNAWCTFSTNAVKDKPVSPVNFEIVLDNYPYASDASSLKVTTEKIPFSYGSVPLSQPSMLEPYYLDLENGTDTVIIPFANFGDGEVVRLLIEPIK